MGQMFTGRSGPSEKGFEGPGGWSRGGSSWENMAENLGFLLPQEAGQ